MSIKHQIRTSFVLIASSSIIIGSSWWREFERTAWIMGRGLVPFATHGVGRVATDQLNVVALAGRHHSWLELGELIHAVASGFDLEEGRFDGELWLF